MFRESPGVFVDRFQFCLYPQLIAGEGLAESLQFAELNARGAPAPTWHAKESRRRARDSRAPPVEGGADGCDARALLAQPTAMNRYRYTNCRYVS